MAIIHALVLPGISVSLLLSLHLPALSLKVPYKFIYTDYIKAKAVLLL